MSHHKGNTYIYTDGACQGNGKENAIGGWAFVCDRYDDTNGGCRKQITRYGGEVGATNNSMELKAVLEGLIFFFTTMDIFERLYIYSDSKYIVKCMQEKWYARWERNGWKNSKGEAVANRQLWEKILWYLREIGINTVEFNWIKGHNGDLFNEMADRLAVKGLEETKEKEKRENE
jgi:ribonuclease HI